MRASRLQLRDWVRTDELLNALKRGRIAKIDVSLNMLCPCFRSNFEPKHNIDTRAEMVKQIPPIKDVVRFIVVMSDAESSMPKWGETVKNRKNCQ